MLARLIHALNRFSTTETLDPVAGNCASSASKTSCRWRSVDSAESIKSGGTVSSLLGQVTFNQQLNIRSSFDRSVISQIPSD